jgi:hypothetical protein
LRLVRLDEYLPRAGGESRTIRLLYRIIPVSYSSSKPEQQQHFPFHVSADGPDFAQVGFQLGDEES